MNENVRVTTVVAADPATAFILFTDEIHLWWRPLPSSQFAPGRRGTLRFEPGAAGRLVELAGSEVHEIGRILAWEPGARLVFEWRGPGFEPGLRTEVEVRFAAVAGGTRVTLEHRGWDRLPPEHAARHGYRGGAFTSMIGLRWADQLVSLQGHARRRSASALSPGPSI